MMLLISINPLLITYKQTTEKIISFCFLNLYVVDILYASVAKVDMHE